MVHRFTSRVKRAARRSPLIRKTYYQLVKRYHAAHLAKSRLSNVLRDRKSIESLFAVNPENMIWIFCASRSGSTWLRSMLADLVPGEVWEEPKVGLLFGRFHDRAHEAQLGSRDFVLGNPTRKVWIPSLRRFVLDTAGASHPSVTRQDYVIVKEPDGAIGAPLIMDALPESRMILLVRDPRDVTASALDAKRKGNWMYEGLDQSRRNRSRVDENPNAFVRARATTYLRAMSRAKQAYDAHKGHKTLVRYEDLRSDTLGSMQALCSALDLPVRKEDLARVVDWHSWDNVPELEKGAGNFYRKASPGSWKGDLTPRQIKIIEETTSSLLEEFYS
ncbi:hypothetical protein BH23ACT11_BH23ACT11_16540 [soil metagenome]